MDKTLSFIGIPVPEPINTEIRRYQKDIQVKKRPNKALRIPTHVTLVPPFYLPKDSLIDLHILMCKIQTEWREFKVELDDFGAFTPRVIYAMVKDNPTLTHLHSELMDEMRSHAFLAARSGEGRYHPHVTIASKSLNKSLFAEEWQKFQDYRYRASWTCASFIRYQHDGRLWHIKAEYPFPG